MIAGRGFDSRHLHQSFRVARLRQFLSGSGMQSGLGRFFKWLDFANPRPVSTGFAGNVSQYLDQIFLVGQIANHLTQRKQILLEIFRKRERLKEDRQAKEYIKPLVAAMRKGAEAWKQTWSTKNFLSFNDLTGRRYSGCNLIRIASFKD